MISAILPAPFHGRPEGVSPGRIPAFHYDGVKSIVVGVKSAGLKIDEIGLLVAFHGLIIPAPINRPIAIKILVAVTSIHEIELQALMARHPVNRGHETLMVCRHPWAR